MGNVHHETANAKLKEFRDNIDPANFLGSLDRTFPNWRMSQQPFGMRYSGNDHHWVVLCSRALHDTLPVPFNTMEYNLDQQHGFTAVHAYGSAKHAIEELQAWVDRAVKENERVRNDA